MNDRLKEAPDEVNEVHDVHTFADEGNCRVTPVAHLSPSTAQEIIELLRGIVRRGHDLQVALEPDADGIVRAQEFEEGDVYMLESPFDGYVSDRYLMDFYDVVDRGMCSRMHLHTGLRFVRLMTGNETSILVSSLAPFVPGTHPVEIDVTLHHFEDETQDGDRRYNFVVPENSWVDIQIPRATSHQFNASGPNAVIDSVHPEESIEVFREQMTAFRMMAQTIFLAEERPPSEACAVPTTAE